VFGLHENANTTTAIKETQALFETLLALQPRSSASGGQSRESVIATLARDIESQLPPNFDIEAASRAYPVSYSNSLHTVLVQELVRFNRLTVAVKRTLSELQKAVKGEVVMSAELEQMGDSMFNGQVPRLWSVVAYPSLKPLGAWVQDLKRRLQMFADWIRDGPPSVFWLSGFFFTQSFLTGPQNFKQLCILNSTHASPFSRTPTERSAHVSSRNLFFCAVCCLCCFLLSLSLFRQAPFKTTLATTRLPSMNWRLTLKCCPTFPFREAAVTKRTVLRARRVPRPRRRLPRWWHRRTDAMCTACTSKVLVGTARTAT
jgi:hypothetical protein